MIRFLFCSFLLISISANAQQTFSFTPSGTLEEQAPFDDYNVYQIDILNETTDTLNLTWRLVEKNFPEGWEVTLCDNVACYGGLPSSNEFYPIFGDNHGFIKLTINPFQVSGTLDFLFLIFPTGEQDNYEEMRFTITAGETTGITTPSRETIAVWPNPARDHVQLGNFNDKALTVKLFNLAGKHLETIDLPAHHQKNIHTDHLESGMYLLECYAEETFLGIQKLIKQ